MQITTPKLFKKKKKSLVENISHDRYYNSMKKEHEELVLRGCGTLAGDEGRKVANMRCALRRFGEYT